MQKHEFVILIYLYVLVLFNCYQFTINIKYVNYNFFRFYKVQFIQYIIKINFYACTIA